MTGDFAVSTHLSYESKFTDRTLKWALFAVWAIGILVGLTFALWLINADHRKCILIPAHYQLVDVLIYASVCIGLFVCYGRILSISWRQRRRVEPVNSVPRWPGRKTTSLSIATASSRVAAGDGTESPNYKPPTSTGASPEQAVTSGAASASELAREQQRQKIKSQRTCSFCVAAGKCFRAFRAERRS